MTRQKSHRARISRGSKIFDLLNYGLLFGVLLIFLFPIYQVLVVSVSGPAAVYASRGMLFWPQDIHFEAYQIVLQNKNILTGLKNSLLYMLLGVSIQYAITIITSYPLSLRGLPGKRIIWTYFLITMYFSGGVIPLFLLITDLKMINTAWALVLPGAVNIGNIIVMRTQFMNIPESLRDAARIDGANDFVILMRIMLPLSMATSAVIILFSIVGYWNMWYEPMLYMTKRSMYPLQSILREIVIDNAAVAYAGRGRTQVKLTKAANRDAVQTLIKYAVIVVTAAPMIAIYPFAQKHFIKGVMIGSIKE